MSRTWWHALLELLGLVVVLENEGVQGLLAADLELDLVRNAVALYSGGCSGDSVSNCPGTIHIFVVHSPRRLRTKLKSWLFLSRILRFEVGTDSARTGSILSPADLDKVLDV